MARVTYQASAQNRPWSPDLLPDTADRILKQSEDYIKKLQAARDFEAAQDAEFIQQYSGSLQRGVDQKRQVDAEQERQARALASYKQSLLADQARRAKTIGGSATGGDSKTMQWAKFITQASETAANAYKQINKINDTANKVIGAELDAIIPVTPFKMGVDKQHTAARTLAQRQENLAIMLEQQGDFVNAERIRKTKAGAYAELERRRAIAHGRNAPGEFQRALYAEQSIMDIVLPDGSIKPINEIRSEKEMRAAYSQFRTPYFEQGGFDVQSKTTLDGLAQSETSAQPMFAEITRQEISSAKKNRLDDADTAFTILVQDPDQAQAASIDYYQDNFNLNGGDHAAARAAVMEKYKNPGQTSNEAFLAWQQTVLPGQNRTVGELYGDEIREVRQARLNESAQIQSESDVQQRTEAKAIAQEVYQNRISDVADDGEVNVPPDVVKEQIAKYTRLGPNYQEAVDAYTSLIPELSSTKRDEEMEEEFQRLADIGGLSEDFIMRTDISEEKKRKWLKHVNATAQQNVKDEDITNFERLSRSMMMRRTGETPGVTGRSTDDYTIRAVRGAVEQFRKDYVAALRDGRSQLQAFEYAEGRFNAEFIKEDGLYKVSKFTDIKDGKEIVVGRFVNFGPQYAAEIEEPFVNIDRMFEKHGPAAVDMPGLVRRETLVRTLDGFKKNNRIMVPANIVYAADKTGGALSVMDVLNSQFKATGLEQIPPDIYGTAKETQDSINPIWHSNLNYKPYSPTKPECVDKCMIGSGQEPIYQQLPKLGEEALAAVMAVESPDEGFEAMNRGVGGDSPGGAPVWLGKSFSDMTIDEVIGHQQAGRLNAAGGVQIVGNTLPEAAELAGIPTNAKFTTQVQKMMFWALLDKYGPGKWTDWWSKPASANTLNLLHRFQQEHDYTKPTWRQSEHMNPALVYRIGSLGYGSTGPHLDVKPVYADGVYGDSSQSYKEGELDKYVSVMHNGSIVPLSQGTITTATDADHRKRGSFGHDYATPDGSTGQGVYLTNGAKIVENWVDNSAEGAGSNRMVIQLPNGKRYAFVHGTAAN